MITEYQPIGVRYGRVVIESPMYRRSMGYGSEEEALEAAVRHAEAIIEGGQPPLSGIVRQRDVSEWSIAKVVGQA